MLYARPARASLVGGVSLQRSPLTIDDVRGGGGFPIVSFAEIADREAAVGFRGFILEVPGEELPRLGEDEYYPFDLEKLAVRDSAGDTVGVVREVIDNPAHPLLAIVQRSGREILVPFVREAVPEVEVGDGYLVVESSFLEDS